MRFHELLEGASMMPYFKDPKDKSQKTWTFPDAWQKDDALDTPYMSNYSMRQFLDALGYNPDFEDNQPPVPAKEFIAGLHNGSKRILTSRHHTSQPKWIKIQADPQCTLVVEKKAT